MKDMISMALISILFYGNNTNNHLEQYLKNKGYQISVFQGKVDDYVLTKEKLLTMPYMIYWGLQTTDPSKYFNRNIQVVKFIVTNHPISKGKVDIYVFVVDGISYWRNFISSQCASSRSRYVLIGWKNT